MKLPENDKKLNLNRFADKYNINSNYLLFIEIIDRVKENYQNRRG